MTATDNNKDMPTRIRKWLSARAPNFLGVEYTTCRPVLAGQLRDRQDISGIDIQWSAPPPPSVFYNLQPDKAAANKQSPDWKLDYVLGKSDATKHERHLINHGDLIYWRPYDHARELRFDDPILVRVRDVDQYTDQDRSTIHEDWLCLRRVGKEDMTLVDDDGNVFIRSKMSETGEIQLSTIAKEDIYGFVFAKFDTDEHPRVQVSSRHPFAKRD